MYFRYAGCVGLGAIKVARDNVEWHVCLKSEIKPFPRMKGDQLRYHQLPSKRFCFILGLTGLYERLMFI